MVSTPEMQTDYALPPLYHRAMVVHAISRTDTPAVIAGPKLVAVPFRHSVCLLLSPWINTLGHLEPL